MSGPLVSVVLPVFNGEQWLRQCLESVFAQTFRPLEVIVVDDGSTDGSVQIAEQAPGEKIVIQQNHGDVARARNLGIRRASGEYVALIDQDDLWEPQKTVRQLVCFTREGGTDLVFTCLKKILPSGREYVAGDQHDRALRMTDENLFEMLCVKNLLMPSSVMARKSSIEKAGLFDESFRTCGDWELWLRMAARGMRFRYVPEALTRYRFHHANASKKLDVMYEDRLRAVEKTFGDPVLPRRLARLRRRALARAHAEGAHAYFSVRDYARFRAAARRVFLLDPLAADVRLTLRFGRALLRAGAKRI